MALKIGIIGFGGSAKTFHIPFILALPNLYVITAIYVRNLPSTNIPLPDAKVFINLDEFLNSEVEVVVVTTPPSAKLDISLACLNAGKHMLLEKPMTVTSKDAEKILKLAKSKNLFVGVYHNRRFDSDFMLLKELCGEDKALGKILELESNFNRFRPGFKSSDSIAWKESGNVPGSGLLYELGSHLIDQALCLFGIPDFVSAVVLDDQRKTVDLAERMNKSGANVDGYKPANDYFHLVLRYGDELVVKLTASNMVRFPSPRFVVNGTKGSLTKCGMDTQESVLKTLSVGTAAPISDPKFGADEIENYGKLCLDSDSLKESRSKSPNGSWVEFYRQFAHAISEKNEKLLPCSGIEGWWVVRVMEAAIESEKTGKTVPIKGVIHPSY